MASLTLRFKIEDQIVHELVLDESVIKLKGLKTVANIKNYLQERFMVPSNSIMFFSEALVNNRKYDDRDYPRLDDDHEINEKGSTVWHWTYISEEPEAYALKKDRCLIILHTAIEQVTADMKMALFGIHRKILTSEEYSEEDWLNLNAIDVKKDVNHITIGQSNYKEVYQKLFPILTVVAERVNVKIQLLSKDMGLAVGNINELFGNLKVLEGESLQKLSGAISESNLQVTKFSTPSKEVTNITSLSLDFSVTSTLFDIQKVSGFFVSLKKERCEYIKIKQQLQTHLNLWVLREYLLQLIYSIPSQQLEVSTGLEISTPGLKIKRRRITYASSGCVPVCCADEGVCFRSDTSYGVIEPFSPPPPPPIIKPRNALQTFEGECRLGLATLGVSTENIIFVEAPETVPVSLQNVELSIPDSSSPVILFKEEDGRFVVFVVHRGEMRSHAVLSKERLVDMSAVCRVLVSVWPSYAGGIFGRTEAYVVDKPGTKRPFSLIN